MLKIYREANAIIAEVRMKMRKWRSNYRPLRAQFLKDGLSFKNVTEQSSKSKVLGLLWDCSYDHILITSQVIFAFIATQPSTKQTVLQAFPILFDSLGFVAPFHMTA